MDLNTFKKLISLIKGDEEDNYRIEMMYKWGMDGCFTPYNRYIQAMEILIKLIYNDEGLDTIYWWLHDSSPKLLYDSITKEIVNDLTSVEELYNYLEKEFKIK